MTIEEVFSRAEHTGVDGSFSRISESHPVDLFVGVEGGRRAIMVVCRTRPPEPPSLGAMMVEARPRQRGEWALIIRLDRPDLTGLFTRVVEDLVDATFVAPPDPGEVVIRHLSRWQRLFSRRPTALLEEHEIRGLAAELSFLVDEAIPKFGLLAAATAWVGPYAAPKDFSFQAIEVEVKATHRQRRSIRISSLEQLTDAGLPICLWCRVVEVERGQSGGLHATFAALVGRVRTVVAKEPAAAERVEDALRAAGYEDRAEYEATTIRFGPAVSYAVRRDFPRIQRPDVSAGIDSCIYEIAVTAISRFLVGSWMEVANIED
ncbi:PD-(D/E)XK motif protein [Corallococcus carmarthensis]|uniref:PD-(D/E)XK motif protein n=1 Tax=Corallococcus carmarthensis TaxID=2316728 RepID=UPI00148DAB5C|nr:PD-(D/E)XK motif protein [Corallococcus carmarthensis]